MYLITYPCPNPDAGLANQLMCPDAKVDTVQKKDVYTIAVVALAPFVTMSSAAMISTTKDKRVLPFKRKNFNCYAISAA